MPWFLRGFFSLVGRFLLCVIFFSSAVMNKIPHYQDTLDVMNKQHVPYPPVLLPGAIAFLLLGSASIIVGFKTRVGALLLLIFLGLTTYYFHNFWDYADKPEMMQQQMIQFLKNLSMGGAMLYLIGNGPGYWSLDRREL